MSSEVSSTVDTCHKDGEDFFPTAEELESYYNMLENGTILELEWQCPGRRAPSPDSSSCGHKEQTNSTDITETMEYSKLNVIKTQKCNKNIFHLYRPRINNDFDFNDDLAQPQMRVRIHHSTPKSVKKKTANFAGVMEALKKKNAEGS